jgi:hypothetical protein
MLNRPLSLISSVALLTGLLSLAQATSADQQDPGSEPVHWAYAAFLGTGWYKLDNNRQVYVLRIPPRWYFRQSSIDGSGQRKVGIDFHFPVTFGLHKLDQIDDLVDFDNIGTVSFNPGVEIEYPLSERWLIRAYGHLGWGKAHNSDESAWIYDAGVKSRYSFQNGSLEWAIFNQVFAAGYNGSKSKSDALNGMVAGLDFKYPIGTWGRTGLRLDWDIAYRWYGNKLSFLRTSSAPVAIGDEWQIGVAIAKTEGLVSLWFLDFEHLGFTYRFNTDGSFQAITFNFRSPFKRW